MGITSALLLLTGFQGMAHTNIFGITHPSMGLLTVMVFALTESFTLTYISAMVKSIKKNAKTKQCAIFDKTRQSVYKHGMITILWVTLVFLLGGAVDTNLLSPFLHGMIYFLGLIHYFYVVKIQHQSFSVCLIFINEMIISKENHNNNSK